MLKEASSSFNPHEGLELVGVPALKTDHDRFKDVLNTYGFAEMPLNDIPYLRSVNNAWYETGLHELHHVIVAFASGAKIIEVSVKPEGNSLGRTVFDGYIAPSIFAKIAMAGAIDPPGTNATGFGHDVFQAKARIGEQSALAKIDAKAILAGIDSKVIEKAAEMLAFRGSVSGATMDKIIKRAKVEVALEEKGLSYLLLGPTSSKEQKEVKKQEKEKLENQLLPEEHTIVETLENGYIQVINVKGKDEIVTVICPICGGENGHAAMCSLGKMENELMNSGEKTTNEEEEVQKLPLTFPSTGVIFEN